MMLLWQDYFTVLVDQNGRKYKDASTSRNVNQELLIVLKVESEIKMVMNLLKLEFVKQRNQKLVINFHQGLDKKV